jgi:hypothetical protein
MEYQQRMIKMKDSSTRANNAIAELEKQFGGVPECKNCLNFERIIKDPITKEEYVKCKSPFNHLSPKKDAYRCYYFNHKSQLIRDNIAEMIERGEELERKMRPTWEDMNRPFTI